MNQLIITGNVVADPEQFGNDKKVSKFTLANERKYGDNKKTCFAPMVCFGKTGEALMQHVKKGTGLMVRGTLNQEQWQDDDGNNRSRLSVIVDSWEFLGPKKEESAGGKSKPKSGGKNSKPKSGATETPKTEEDNIPF